MNDKNIASTTEKANEIHKSANLASQYARKQSANALLRQQIVSMFLALCLGIVAIFTFTGFLKVEPAQYAIMVEDGNASFGGYLQKGEMGNEYTPYEIQDFIIFWRTITADGALLSDNIKAAYCFLPVNSSARNLINAQFVELDPYERATDTLVSVTHRKMMQLGPNSYSAEWVETVRDHGGNTQSTLTWTATFVIRREKIKDECTTHNPLGIFVADITGLNSIYE